jgi:inosine/xanthosine triphosphate pyrophosphatase family protein
VSQPPIIYFATTSDVKLKQYTLIFREIGFELVRAPMIASAFIEPQVDPSQPDSELIVVAHPLRQAARFAEKINCIPYMKEDTMLTIRALSAATSQGAGLPGPDTKSWWRNLGAEGVLRVLKGKRDRTAIFTCHIGAYLGKGQYRFAQASINGQISTVARVSKRAEKDFPRSNPFFFHSIFEPEGSSLTLAEMNGREFQTHDYRRKCAKELCKELKDFSFQQNRQMSLPLAE